MASWSSSLADPSSVSVVIPALDEASSIGDVVGRLRAAALWHEVLVVDDGSHDGTQDRARAAGARVIRHPYTKGNGAAVKTGIRSATGEFILIVDADGQHPPEDARRLVTRLGEYDLVIGARAPATQASLARRSGNAVLNGLAGYLTGHRVHDLTSGFRGARSAYLREFLHLLPNGFSTPATTTLAFMRAGYNVAFEPVDARSRMGRSKIRFARDGAKFLLILLKVITLFSPLRVFIPLSVVTFAVGALYGVVNVTLNGRIPNGSLLLILFAALVFLVGVVSDQISSLRFEGPAAARAPASPDEAPARLANERRPYE
jgi:glycosyltransferase involved in cell wall biosynthesis